MGPLVPNIIGNELNLVLALAIGFCFGMVLEQAGFSATRKLAGLFYGYDFTVLRVFFTAGIVAMFGVIVMDHFGMIDMNLIFINPTFFWSAIIGGGIMGLGFIIGGFCPGTGLCAAAIGKIDGILFVVGSFLGVLVFAEGYPIFEGVYKAANWGGVRIFDSLGMPQTLFAFLLTAVAMFAFWFVSIVENRTNKVKAAPVRFTPYYLSLTAIGCFIAISSLFLPGRKDAYMDKVNNKEYVSLYNVDKMSIDEFAYRMLDNEKDLQIFDFRSQKEFEKWSLPQSYSLTVDSLLSKEQNKYLWLKDRVKIVVAYDEYTEKQMAIIMKELGVKNVFILEGGLNNFNSGIINFDKNKSVNLSNSTVDFRERATIEIKTLIQQNKQKTPAKSGAKRVIGGC